METQLHTFSLSAANKKAQSVSLPTPKEAPGIHRIGQTL